MDIVFEYLKKYKIYLILLIIGLILFNFKVNKSEEVNQDLVMETEENKTIEEDKIIKVDIKGAVNNPGVYEIASSSRVSDAINISGGLTSDADTTTINLSKNLVDEMVIIIYTKDEINEFRSGSTSIKYIENECVCPQIKNDVCIEEIITNIEIVDNSSNEDSSKININTATKEELMNLKGIGESKANLIIEYRNNNKFNSIEDIKNVKGIGDAIYEKIKDSITI